MTTLYELESGKLLRVRVFVDHAEALEAAGLRELSAAGRLTTCELRRTVVYRACRMAFD